MAASSLRSVARIELEDVKEPRELLALEKAGQHAVAVMDFKNVTLVNQDRSNFCPVARRIASSSRIALPIFESGSSG